MAIVGPTDRFREAARKVAVEVVDFAQGCTIENCYSLRHHERSHEHAEWEIAQALAAAYAAGQAEALAWRPIETALDNETMLTMHTDDLYPVPAYRMDGHWLRETEGPEDTFYGAGRHEPLYRAPTHCMPLPPPPAAEPAREDGA